MNIGKLLLTIGGTFLLIVVLDLLWVGVVAKSFYQENLRHLLAENIQWVPVILFYVMYTGMILYFAVFPAVYGGSWQKAVISGVLLGMACYGTYNFTNGATLRDWPVQVVLLDVIWGAVMTGCISFFSYQIARLV